MAEHPSSYVICFNVSKRHNIGTIARCCTAFGVRAVCLVGSREYNTFGSHGSDVYVHLKHFNTLQDCCDALRGDGCRILGIEITDAALPVHDHPFTGSTAFMLGNEGQGLSSKQKEFCDGFVYISQYGNGTASLNVAVACSIVLHHFALWAGYDEHERQGEKYAVGERPTRAHARGVVPPTEEERLAIQQRRQHGAGTDEADAADAAQHLTQLFDE